MKPPRIPSFYIALGTRFAADSGIDPEHLHAVVQGRLRDDELARRLVVALHPLADPREYPGLTARPEARTIRTMRTAESDIARPRIGRPLKSSGYNKAGAKLVAALKAAGRTLAEEAKAAHRTPTALRQYCAPKDCANYRPAPRQLVKRWEGEPYNVPAGDWPKTSD